MGGGHTVSCHSLGTPGGGTAGGDLTELLFLRLPPMTPSLIFSGAIFFPFIFLFSSGTRGLLLRFLWPGPGGGTGPPCPQGAQGDGRTSPRGCGEQRGQRCSHKGKGSLGGGNDGPKQEWDPKVWE